jgi:hypothetical protein
VRVVLLTSLIARVAIADPDDLVARPIVLDDGQVEARLVVEADLETVGRPLSLAPDAWWGATPRLTVGIIHSDAAIDRIADGASVCVVSGDTSCAHAYHDVGVDARWAATDTVAPRLRVLVRDVSPVKPALAVGALVRWHRGRVALAADPYLQLGLANTDRGNRAALVVPLEATIQPTCGWAVALATGYVSDLAVWHDGYHVPVALTVTARATVHLDVSIEAGFPSLLGPQNTVKEREAWLVLAWRS